MDSRLSSEYNNGTQTVFANAVQSQSAKKAILTTLADEEMVKILDSFMYHSKSIVYISEKRIVLIQHAIGKPNGCSTNVLS